MAGYIGNRDSRLVPGASESILPRHRASSEGSFALDGTDHPNHIEQARMIRRHIAWANRNAHDRALCELVKRANVA